MGDKIGKGITPLTRGMKYQQLSTPKEYKGDKKLKKYEVKINGRILEIEYDGNGGVIIDGKIYNTSVIGENENIYLAKVEVTKKQVHRYKIEYSDGMIFLEGKQISFSSQAAVPKLKRKKSSRAGGEEIRAPLPGSVISIPVKIGDEVKSGMVVAILEAMKMQNDIQCTSDGYIKDLRIEEGQQVNTDQLIMIIAPLVLE